MNVNIDIPRKGCKVCTFLSRVETMEVGLSPDDMYCNLFKGAYLGTSFNYKPLDKCIKMRKRV